MMRQGFLTAGLAVLSIFLMQTSAEARAPIVADPGDFIISDLESDDGGTSGANVFVYPDAFDLDDLVFDDNEATSDIKWSYAVTGGNIRLNDADPLGAGDPVDPPVDNRIDLNDDPESLDADMSTVTLRNDDLSTSGTVPDAGNEPAEGDGILNTQTATVTLFASDCTTFSQTSMIVYTFNANPATITGLPAPTDAAGDQRIPENLMNVLSVEFKNDANGWTARQFAGNESLGGTTSVDPDLGLCMTVDNAGDNGVEWRSPTNYVDLTQRAIYRARLFMLTDQTAVAQIPVWDFNYLNIQGPADTNPGFLNYGGRRFVVDTEGGANGIGRDNGRGYFEFWFAPAAVDTPQWNGEVVGIGGAFTPAASVNTGMRLIVRVLDFDESLQASTRSGSIYLGKIVIDKFPIEELDENANVIYNEPISDADYRAFRPSTAVDPLAVATFNETENTLTIQLPSAADATVDPVRATLGPEDESLTAFITDPNTGATVRNPLRLYPAQWETDTLYRGRVGIIGQQLSIAGLELSNPVDIIDVTHDTYTLELGGSDFVTSGDAGLGDAGMPLAGSPVDVVTNGVFGDELPPQWHTYFYGNNSTDSLIQNVDRWRMQVDFFNRADLGIAEPKDQTGDDPFTITDYILDEINFDPSLVP